jgi:hypothetical protein
MRRIARPIRWLPVVVALAGFGCGKIDLPVIFGLVGDSNAMSVTVPALGGATIGPSPLTGGAEATVEVNLDPFKLFSPQGLVASIQVNSVLIAAASVNFLGLDTGSICVFDDPNNPGGGLAFLRPLQQQADFTLTMYTLVNSPLLSSLLGPPPTGLPFPAEIDKTVPLTLNDLFSLLGGKGAGIQISDSVSYTLTADDVGSILGGLLVGSTIEADVTLGTVQSFPTSDDITACESFLAGP